MCRIREFEEVIGPVGPSFNISNCQVVSVLALYSNDLSSMSAEVYNFPVNSSFKRTKINRKRPELA